jgi:hypothetical protein
LPESEFQTIPAGIWIIEEWSQKCLHHLSKIILRIITIRKKYTTTLISEKAEDLLTGFAG